MSRIWVAVGVLALASIWRPAAASPDPDHPLVFAPGTLQLREGQQVANRSLVLTMQSDGNLVLYDGFGHALWSSNTYHRCTHCLAIYQMDGNLVVYNVDSDAALYATGFGSRSLALGLDDPFLTLGSAAPYTDAMTFTPGTLRLREGQSVSSHELLLTMQADGNLVLYGLAGVALWSSSTYQRCTRCLAIYQTDGNLVVYDVDTGGALYATGFGSVALTMTDAAPYLRPAMPGAASDIWNVNLARADHAFKGVGWNTNISLAYSPAMIQLLDDTTLQFVRAVGWTIDGHAPQPGVFEYEAPYIQHHYDFLQYAKSRNISVMMTNWDGGGNRWNPYRPGGDPAWPHSPFWMSSVTHQGMADRFCHHTYHGDPGICPPGATELVTGTESDHPYSDQVFAETITRHLSYMVKDKGFTTIDFVSLWNEPNGDWSYHPRDASRTYPASFTGLYQRMASAMTAAGLTGVKLTAMDETTGAPLATEFATASWASYARAYSLHDYGGAIGPAGEVSRLRDRAGETPIIIGEVGPRGVTPDCPLPVTSAYRWARSMETTQHMLSDIRHGAYAVARWWYYGGDPETDCNVATAADGAGGVVVIAENYNAIKIFANTLPQLRQDVSVLSCDVGASGGDVEAVAINAAPAGQPAKLVLWFVNRGAADHRARIWIQGLASSTTTLHTKVMLGHADNGAAPYAIRAGRDHAVAASSPLLTMTIPADAMVVAYAAP